MKKYYLKFRMLPVLLFTAVVLLLVRAKSYYLNTYNNPDIPIISTTELWDVFSSVKASAVFYIAIFALLIMAYLLITGQMKIKKTAVYIPMAIYTAFVIISYAMSDYKAVSFLGGYQRFEGTRTIISYMFMLFYTINVIDDIKDACCVIASSLLAVFLGCVIGLSQFIGHDILLSDFASAIILGKSGISLRSIFEPGQVYQTVSNMNYVGMYLTLPIPILLYVILFLWLPENKGLLLEKAIDSKKRLLITVTCVLLLLLIGLNICGADSVGGQLGVLAGIWVMLFVLSKKNWQKILLIICAVIGLISAIFYMYANGVDDKQHTGRKQLEYLKTGPDYVEISINDKVLRVIYNHERKTYELRDSDGKSIEVFWFADEEGMFQVDDDRFAGEIVIIPFDNAKDEPCVALYVTDVINETFAFVFREDGAKYLNPHGREVPLGKVESIGFKGHLSAGSGRGFIWSRTLPLLKNCLFKGYGADVFLHLFPQNDYAGKYTSGSPIESICGNPHNLYLNIAVGTGIISLIAYLAMIVMIMLKVFRSDSGNMALKMLSAGIIGFLFAGFFNDSTVSIMPMFYGLLGTVTGVIYREKKK